MTQPARKRRGGFVVEATDGAASATGLRAVRPAVFVAVARERGLAEVVVGAQLRAIGFYERHGFRAEGPV